MRRHAVDSVVLGPWSAATSRAFWEGFSPAVLEHQQGEGGIRTVFRVEADWSRAEVEVTQHDQHARISIACDGDLEAAADQVRRFLSLDVDARGWPDVARRDPVIADAQDQLPGLRPCGFHSPYEAAAWSVLSQRIRIVQAARLQRDPVDRHGDAGAFPAPQVLRCLDLDLPGRKSEYLHAVADAALEGRLDGNALRSASPDAALRSVQEIKGLGPFAAELVVLRGANAPDVLPRHERRLDTEIGLGGAEAGVRVGEVQVVRGGRLPDQPQHGDPVGGRCGEQQGGAGSGDAAPFGYRCGEVWQVGEGRYAEDGVEAACGEGKAGCVGLEVGAG